MKLRTERTLGETGTEKTRNLLDKSLRGQERIIFLGELLDELLVLVEPWRQYGQESPTMLQETMLTSSSHQRTCTQDQSVWHGRCRLRRRECRWTCGGGEREGACSGRDSNQLMRQGLESRRCALDGTRETLVTLGVVVLEANLEFDGLHKVTPLLAGSVDEKLLDGAPHA
ncbi:hypothetical protein BC628DRAFT_365188 [Trametes gibbosa]|nr:hypothetical protein BC628DRAFT_365188 [Trametes gibbosa]